MIEKKFKFNTFDKVLVRNCNGVWLANQFDFFDKGVDRPYFTLSGLAYDECIPYNEETKHLHRTTEPYEPSYEPKDGDFVIIGSKLGFPYDQYIAIYKGEEIKPFGIYKSNYVYAYASMAHHTEHQLISFDCGGFEDSKVLRRATEEEKQLLLNKMHEQGKDWDVEKHEVVDYKWKPTLPEDPLKPLRPMKIEIEVKGHSFKCSINGNDYINLDKSARLALINNVDQFLNVLISRLCKE